jgi:steroid 5-alpha reductase family enzyme
MADEQQWAFQCGKRKLGPRRAAWASDYARGFLTHGLWGYSRHPNVSCEQLIWVWVSMAAVPAFGALNFTSAGAITLILLTVRSTFLTEAISSAKYPAYRRYQDLVPMFWPLAGSTNLDEIERAE